MAFSPLESLFSLCTLRSLCPLCKILCFFPGACLTGSCISGNPPAAVSLRTFVPALHCPCGHHGTPRASASLLANRRPALFLGCLLPRSGAPPTIAANRRVRTQAVGGKSS